MNFRSDNEVGAHPSIIEAVSRAFSSGSAFSYGADDWTQRVRATRSAASPPPMVAAMASVPGTMGTPARCIIATRSRKARNESR